MLAECERRLALEGAKALETAFDWEEHPIEAEGACWCKLQDLLFKIAGTTFEAGAGASGHRLAAGRLKCHHTSRG